MWRICTILVSGIAIIATMVSTGRAQSRNYPDKIRGYKVERAVIEIKAPDAKNSANNNAVPGNPANDPGIDKLMTFGKPSLARVTPLGITFEVPIVIAPVTQSGKVDFLIFEDIAINGQSVNIADYNHPFHLPNSKPLTLKDPLSIYVYLPSALLAAIGEWTESKDDWPVTGRVYVFGKFKKGLLSFKRCVPVELDLTMHNPLKEK
jgi:hypothetical protein